MELLTKSINQIRNQVWILSAVLITIVGVIITWLVAEQIFPLAVTIIILLVTSLIASYIISYQASRLAKIPLEAFGNAITHLSPSLAANAAPQTDNLRIGREFVTQMVYQLYQIASLQDNKDMAEHKREATQASNIIARLPLPLFVFNNQQIVTFASDSALGYLAKESSVVFGRPLFESMDLEFPSDFTLESWVDDCSKNKATDTAYWHQVRLRLKDDQDTVRQCDLAGYYNRDNPTGIEFIVTVFDRTQEYNKDDQSLGFLALAVHELRTPLTLMRGLIEVFQEELDGKLDPEMAIFMNRLQGSSQQLSAFVNNILNVAKIEGNQLTIKLVEQNWADIIKHSAEDMENKATDMGKELHFNVPDNLPTIAADSMMTYEVLCNLIDNAIKYSGKSKIISVSVSVTSDGLVETTVTDMGVGMPTGVVQSLFEKFQRNHRNQSEISGTGLGLYLSKAIINAHGGNIWVKSKENEGTTVGFTVKPYSMLAQEQKTSNNKDTMVRTAHGWIKNHSLYRS